jgi:hypothetical protein
LGKGIRDAANDRYRDFEGCELEQYGSRCKWKWYCKIKVGDAAKVEVDAYLKNNLKVSWPVFNSQFVFTQIK